MNSGNMKSKIRINKLITTIAFVFCIISTSTAHIRIIKNENPSNKSQLTAQILEQYLAKMLKNETIEIADDTDSYDFILLKTVSDISEKEKTQLLRDFPQLQLPTNPESFSFKGTKLNGKSALLICGYDERGLLYGVYEVLEKLGCRFYLSDEFVPEIAGKLELHKLNGSNVPLADERIVFNWHNFLSGITGWNLPEYKQWIDATVKMKYNTIMVHAYGNNPMMRFEFNGVKKPTGLIASTVRGRDWGINHVNDIRNLYGGNAFKDSIFGSDASRLEIEQMNDSTIALMQNVFRYASERSVNINFAFDIATTSSTPLSLMETLPKSAQLKNYAGNILANPETPEGYNYFKTQLTALLKDYPQLTHLTPWVRYMRYSGIGVFLAIENMPKQWNDEYENILAENPTFKKDQATNSFYYIAKILQAYTKALKELGREDIKLGLGTWNWVAFPFLDKFIDKNVAFYPIDWDMNFDTEYARQELAKIRDERKVYPVVWAHHDDHSYIGRPFDPPAKMMDKLKERKAEGFGILHWTTWPLDLYFKNLSQQTWQQTKNESYSTSIEDYALHGIQSESAEFNDYLKKFYLEAPHFARETSDYFYDIYLNKVGRSIFPVYDPVSIVESTKERLKMLEHLNNSAISKTDIFKYYQKMEEFFVLYFENQQMLIDAAGIWMNNGDRVQMANIIKITNPEQAVEKYAEAIQYGPNTLGEQAIILRLNLNWLPDFADIKQKAGLIPIDYTFFPTNHEAMAEGAGQFAWYFKKDKSYAMCLGEKETNGATVLPDHQGVLKLDTAKVSFSVGYWRISPQNYFSDTFKNNKLRKGKYVLVLRTSQKEGNSKHKKIKVELRNESAVLLNADKTTFQVKNNEVQVPFEIDNSLLNISLKTVDSTIELEGFSIEWIK